VRIASDQMNAGYPATEVRDFARRCRFVEFLTQAAELTLALSPGAAAIFLNKLVDLGLVKNRASRIDTRFFNSPAADRLWPMLPRQDPFTGLQPNASFLERTRRLRAPSATIQAQIRERARHPGLFTPCLSISMAFPRRFNRVSSFLASAIQRQYSLRWV